jgi:gluconokinase
MNSITDYKLKSLNIKNKTTKNQYLFIIMGVSGSGKTSLAKQLAEHFGFTFVDADNFHSTAAKEHMAANNPLTDEMRIPWLTNISHYLSLLKAQGKSIVLAYSGLKSAHRDLMREQPFCTHFFYLNVNKAELYQRIEQRQGHFFSKALLNSQVEAMQSPTLFENDISTINGERSLSLVVGDVTNFIRFIIRKKKYA